MNIRNFLIDLYINKIDKEKTMENMIATFVRL